MAIYRILQYSPFGPDEIQAMVIAYEEAIQQLALDREHSSSQVLARRIVEIAQTGVKDAAELRDLALRDFGTLVIQAAG